LPRRTQVGTPTWCGRSSWSSTRSVALRWSKIGFLLCQRSQGKYRRRLIPSILPASGVIHWLRGCAGLCLPASLAETAISNNLYRAQFLMGISGRPSEIQDIQRSTRAALACSSGITAHRSSNR
jgi:hypothetical protein